MRLTTDQAIEVLKSLAPIIASHTVDETFRKDTLRRFDTIYREVLEGGAASDLGLAVKTLTDALDQDEALYESYRANIAMAFHDATVKDYGITGTNTESRQRLAKVCNEAADNFLKMFIKSTEV